MSMIIHQSGIDAAINAQADGFSGATLSYVDLFDGTTTIKRLDLEAVQVIEPSRIYVVAQDSTTDTYDITKMEFITDGGVLFATVQHDDGSVIQSKGPATAMVLAEQLNLSAAPGSVAPSGDVSIYAPQATESLLGTAELATQAEADAGTDDSRIITPKKLWALLTAKFARKDIRPTFSEGINTGGKPIVYSGSGTNVDHIWYDDGDNEFHLVADKEEGAAGNANVKVGGIQLNTGVRVTGVSDSATSTSKTTLATSYAVDVARDDGTRQATESQRGQAEIATQAEVDAGTNHERIVTPKTLKSRLASFTRNATETVKGFVEIATQAETETGTDDSKAVTPKKLRWGFSYYLGQSGYIKLPNWLHGAIIQWGAVVITNGGQDVLVTFPLAFPNQVFGVCASYRGAAFANNPGKGLTCTPVSLSQFNLNTFSTMEGSGDQAFFYISIGK